MTIRGSQSALLVCTAMALISSNSAGHAQEATAQNNGTTVLERITVKGKRVQSGNAASNAASQTPLASTTAAEDIRKKEINNINDLGKTTEPGVDYVNGTPGRSGGLYIRGMSGVRVATLIDGIPVPYFQNLARSGFSSPSTNASDGTNSFDFSSLSTVDVVRGADSSRIGGGAIGGALVLRTLEPEDLIPEGRNWGGVAKLTFDGDDRSAGGSVAVAKKIENTSVLFQGGYKKGHERDNQGDQNISGVNRTKANPSDYDQNNLLFKVRQDVEGGHRFGVTAERFDSSSDTDLKSLYGVRTAPSPFAPAFVPGNYSGFEDTRRERVSLDYSYDPQSEDALIDSAWMSAYWQRVSKDVGSQGQITTFGVTLPFARSNLIEENSFGLTGAAISAFEAGGLQHEVRFGGTAQIFETEQFLSGSTAASTNRPDMPDVDGRKLGLYVEDKLSVANSAFSVTPGVRLDWYDYDPKKTNGFVGSAAAGNDGVRLSPKLLAAYDLSPETQLFAQWSMAYRAPTVNELYVFFPGGTYNVTGNPNLKAETGHGFEIGANYNSADLSGKLTVFHNRYSNYIDVVNFATVPRLVTYRNVGDVEISGVEVKGRKDFANGIFLHGALTYSYGKNADTGEFLRTVAPFKSVLGVGYEQESWGVDLTTIISAGMRKDGPGNDVLANSTFDTFDAPGYGIFNLTGWWEPEQTKGLRIQAGIYNVLDKTYYNAVGVRDVYTNPGNTLNDNINQPVAFYSEPGRTFKISLTQKF